MTITLTRTDGACVRADKSGLRNIRLIWLGCTLHLAYASPLRRAAPVMNSEAGLIRYERRC